MVSKKGPRIPKCQVREVKRAATRCSRKGIREVDAKLVEDAQARGHLLGDGVSGVCYLFHGEDGLPLSVKIFHCRQRRFKTVLSNLYDEAKQMTKVKDISGIIRLVGVSLWPIPAIVTQYGGEALSHLLDEGKVSFQAVEVMTQIVSIMSELTKANLCHGDLHSNNIVVKDTEEGPVVTIIDLGWMEEFGFNPGWKKSDENTIYAPELRDGCPFSPATQVYQVGMVLKDILECVDVGDSALEKLAVQATEIASDRPTMEEILQHVKGLFESRKPNLVLKRKENQSNEEDTI